MISLADCKLALGYSYCEAAGRLVNQLPSDLSLDKLPPEILKKFVLYHVKYMPLLQKCKNLNLEELEGIFRSFDTVHYGLSRFTPREFMQYFPIKKEYDGKKYEEKDYFTTMKYLKTLNWDEPVGADRIDDFLWEYLNVDLMNFEVQHMMIGSDLRVARGGRDIMEEWMEQQGLPTYSMFTDSQGRQIMQNNQTGVCTEVKEYKRRPKWIHAVK